MNRFILLLLLSSFLPAFSQTNENGPKKQGYWRKKDEKTNKLLYEGQFKDDKPIGKFKYYYPNDSVKAIINFLSNGKTAYARMFHTNGKRMAEGKYINKETKDSIWTFYDESGNLLSKEQYSMGKKDGASYVYLPDGGLSEERHFVKGVQEGPFRQYFDGKKMKASGTYLKGELEGRASYFYPNGVEVAAGYYKNGVKNGPWVYKTEQGKIKDKELYRNGKLAGKKETEAFFNKDKSGETPQK
jgi:antitoxin component YwqK of YwqJK toxin-antitoxin module